MKIIFLFFIILISSQTIHSQTSEITGRVTDKSNQLPLGEVAVAVLKSGTVLYGAETYEDGFFRITDVEVGLYSLRFNQIGFKTLIMIT